ncbi:class I SAM-dependent methyltransferase [Candidatus Woesebacteria bacterium]|nr:class I SAM-dependent methyltransferase [Candidatus Woesebacteria bacterium]MCD8506781.1 class I SAM-dependent methyltransferase [Candidatus Woesebacteria bacterium]MCD8527689.1 class I SAM-dependent methyltransferase [Candidatus Woesebacteria bacterium]MCD8546341.1 class I SAM-dependent methyltransferase [Candidatus Woesebacteria bacterium]
MSMNQKVKAGYNNAAEQYNADYRNEFKNKHHLDWLLSELNSGSMVLDVGCGAGKPVDDYLIENQINVLGIDISEKQIELARANVRDADYQVLDMSELKEGQFTVDAVVSFYAIFHTPREGHLELLKKFRTFLDAGGYLLVTMGATDWEGSEDDFCGAEMHWSHYGADQNKDLIEKAGFKILKSEIDNSGDEKHLIVFAQAI